MLGCFNSFIESNAGQIKCIVLKDFGIKSVFDSLWQKLLIIILLFNRMRTDGNLTDCKINILTENMQFSNV